MGGWGVGGGGIACRTEFSSLSPGSTENGEKDPT